MFFVSQWSVFPEGCVDAPTGTVRPCWAVSNETLRTRSPTRNTRRWSHSSLFKPTRPASKSHENGSESGVFGEYGHALHTPFLPTNSLSATNRGETLFENIVQLRKKGSWTPTIPQKRTITMAPKCQVTCKCCVPVFLFRVFVSWARKGATSKGPRAPEARSPSSWPRTRRPRRGARRRPAARSPA